MTTYVLAGGCFWCIDAVFRRLKGVETVFSGYAGGQTIDPTYAQVATGETGHAEAVQVTFDEKVLPAAVLLDLFFLIHNPTTLNRQGADVGTQYRSAMFYKDEEQHQEFLKAVVRAEDNWDDPIVTEIAELNVFYPAEEEHQDYFNKNPASGYCTIVIAPKIVKARAAYSDYFKEN